MRNYILEGDFKALSTLQSKEEEKLFALANVVGVGLSNKVTKGTDTGEPCLTVFVEQKLDKELLSGSEMVPATVGKYKTDVVEVGSIFAYTDMTNRQRYRPAMGGNSVAHVDVTAGTIATTVIDSNVLVPRRYYILSNNHVLADSNGGAIGDPVFQPGPIDGGADPSDRIGRLARFVPLQFGGILNNRVDAAIAEVDDFEDCSPEIYSIGYVQGIGNVQVNSIVHKSGRTTGYTRGRVLALNVTLNVGYSGNRVARFINQIVTTDMSDPGDSGSLVLDLNNRAIGLLFAGSPFITVMNPISFVLPALQIQFLG